MMAKVFPASSMVRRPQSKFGAIWSTVGGPCGNTWFWLQIPLEKALQAKSAKVQALAGMPAKWKLPRIKSKWSWWRMCWDFVEKLNGLALRAHAILGLRLWLDSTLHDLSEPSHSTFQQSLSTFFIMTTWTWSWVTFILLACLQVPALWHFWPARPFPMGFETKIRYCQRHTLQCSKFDQILTEAFWPY